MTKSKSKFRHVFADDVKLDKRFLDLPKAYTTGEDNFMSCNGKYLAVHKASAGGPVVIGQLDTPCRWDLNTPTLCTHNGRVLVSRWNPFVDDMIATGSEDQTVQLNLIPENFVYGKDDNGDRFKNISTPLITMKGHQKKVTLLDFHPCANNILASASHDKTVKVWDFSTQDELLSHSLSEVPFSLQWNYDGTLLGFTSKEKKLTVMDPRQADAAISFQCVKNTKSTKLFWLGKQDNFLGTTGYTSGGSKRCIRLFDFRNTEKHLHQEELLDNSSSVLMPHYDADIDLLWTYGKGDGSISFYDCANATLKFLGVNRNSKPAKGGFFAPKLACDTTIHEVQLFLKMEVTGNTMAVIPYHFTAPRKTHDFCQDIYPDTRSNEPSVEGTDWWSGKDVKPKLTSMDPEKRGDVKQGGFVKKLTYKELEQENADLKAQIEELKKQLEG